MDFFVGRVTNKPKRWADNVRKLGMKAFTVKRISVAHVKATIERLVAETKAKRAANFTIAEANLCTTIVPFVQPVLPQPELLLLEDAEPIPQPAIDVQQAPTPELDSDEDIEEVPNQPHSPIESDSDSDTGGSAPDFTGVSHNGLDFVYDGPQGKYIYKPTAIFCETCHGMVGFHKEKRYLDGRVESYFDFVPTLAEHLKCHC